MAIRLEWVLLLANVLLIAFVYLSHGKHAVHRTETFDKELAFSDTEFNEVNQSRILSRGFAKEGERKAGVLYLRAARFRSDAIRHMQSDRAKDDGNTIYLNGNVVAITQKGYRYVSEDARYAKTSELLWSDTPFTATKDSHVLEGRLMRYDAKNGVMRAWQVHAYFSLEKEGS